MSRRLSVMTLGVLVSMGAWTAVASAHVPAAIATEPVQRVVPLAGVPVASWQSADPLPAIPWVLVLIVLAALTVGARRPRSALAVTVAACLAVFAFENGVHSVHHLNDDVARASCAIATASAHVGGTVVDSGTGESPALPLSERLVVDRLPHAQSHSLAVHQGRAPPLAA